MPWTDYFWTRPPPSLSAASPPTPEPPAKDDRPSLSITTSSGLDYYRTLPPSLAIALPTAVLTTSLLLSFHVYRTRLRPFPTAAHIPPSFFRRRSLYGYVPSVGDGDNFRLLHTPGGKLAGWGVVPWRSRHLAAQPPKLQTIHVRIAGVDAPELAHFGRPAQPYGQEALEWLRHTVLKRGVRVMLYRRDQYERVVGTAWVRAPDGVVVGWLRGVKGWGKVLALPVEAVLRLAVWLVRVCMGRTWRDVGLEMIRGGWATVYEAKFGSEFGGEKVERVYRRAEAEAKGQKLGMWSGGKSELEKEEGGGGWLDLLKGRKKRTVESPREYKNRMKDLEEGKK